MLSGYLGVCLIIVGGVAAIWWVTAPVLASIGDKRLRLRNPDHHAKIVRFYRAWGLLAVAFGVTISTVLR